MAALLLIFKPVLKVM